MDTTARVSNQAPLQNSSTTEPLNSELKQLSERLTAAQLPDALDIRMQAVLVRLNRAANQPGYIASYEEAAGHIDWLASLPWNQQHLDNLDLRHAQQVLNQNHYGLIPIKQRILEYLSVLTLQSRTTDSSLSARSPVLCFIGLPGIGKTSIASSIAESLGRPFVRIAMGGMGAASQIRGRERTQPGGEPGQVIKALRRVGVNNPVILLDEIDRTAESARAEIMGVLLELLDPEQNDAFTDAYIDHPFNLSRALFLASANNTTGIANAVLDRLEVIQMPGYSDDEKIHIARDYLFPRQLQMANIAPTSVIIEETVWPLLVRPLGFDAGIRTMERILNGVVRKIALQMVAHQTGQFHITEANYKQYLAQW